MMLLRIPPQERFPYTIKLHELDLEAGTSLRCEIQFQSSQTARIISKSKHDLEVDQDGRVPPLGPLTLDIPDAEGVYDLHVSLYQNTLTGAFLPSKPIHRRSLQLVVIDAQPEAPEPMPDFAPGVDDVEANSNWTSILSIDPANPTWWKRIMQIRQLSIKV